MLESGYKFTFWMTLDFSIILCQVHNNLNLA